MQMLEFGLHRSPGAVADDTADEPIEGKKKLHLQDNFPKSKAVQKCHLLIHSNCTA